MKSIKFGLVVLAALFAAVAYPGQAVKAAEEIRLRANLSDPVVDPLGLNIAEFRQRPDRNRFSVEIHQVAEIGTGKVIVKREAGVTLPDVIILEAPIAIVVDPLRGMGTFTSITWPTAIPVFISASALTRTLVPLIIHFPSSSMPWTPP